MTGIKLVVMCIFSFGVLMLDMTPSPSQSQLGVGGQGSFITPSPVQTLFETSHIESRAPRKIVVSKNFKFKSDAVSLKGLV